jgi:hypothetical protein
MTAGRFFGLFFIVHLVVSAGYYLLASQGGGGPQGIGAVRVGMGVFGAMQLLFVVAGRQSSIEPTLLPLLLVVNSALTAGVATGIFLVVRRLRAA